MHHNNFCNSNHPRPHESFLKQSLKKKLCSFFFVSFLSLFKIMAFQFQFQFLTPIWLVGLFCLTAFASQSASSDEGQVPKFAFSWLDDNNTFQAGDVVAIKIIVLGSFDSKGNASLDRTAFNPTFTVNGKTGNSSIVSGVFVDSAGDTSSWRILFIPIRVGIFNVIIEDGPFKVFDSSLDFNVIPGSIYPSVCIASWKGLLNEFEAGAKATILISPRDAFGNKISSTGADISPYNFTVSALYPNGSFASIPRISHMGWNEFGNITIEFIAEKAGNLLLLVNGENHSLNGSPLPFRVYPGPLDFSSCLPKWNFETPRWQIFSKMEIFIHQQDQYGNLVPGLYEFDADVVEKETSLSVPVADLHFEEVVPGIQLFSFSLQEPGNFLLTISDSKHNRSISNMPFAYTVFIGYCDGSASIINGSGLNASVAGDDAQFSLYLNDLFQYPSFLEAESIRVQILRELDSYHVQPKIYPIINETAPGQGQSYVASSQTAIAPVPFVGPSNTSVGNSKSLTSTFNVTYTPEKSGIYEIYVFCGNILLNGGRSFRKEVIPAEVNISLSRVAQYAPKAPKNVENEIIVQLMDSFSNPIRSQQSRLTLEITSVNRSGSSSGTFEDNNDGSYAGHHLVEDVGTYEMCVSFNGMHLSPCPFRVNVYSGEYFPKAYSDNISVWEDESVAFDVLANDYFAGNNASIIEFSRPDHGSLLQYGHLFRYTPYIDYYGNDSFAYTISDMNGNLASAAVNIYVLNIPPQFISFPSQLQATEDLMSPRFSGFPGFEMRYSDPTENISITISAQFGTVSLSPMTMQFWQPMWSEFSVKRGGNQAKELILEGRVEVINLALHSVQYLGCGNFSGNDTLRVSASNMNGKNSLDVPVFVEPINDPPFINVPRFIPLRSNGDEQLVFDRNKNEFEFSVGDPDVLNFPGRESDFFITFSLEVDDGFLVTSLPAELINTTELKLTNNYQWQPLQTYVTISKHFLVRASGVRFRGKVNDCNSIMQQLLYHGGERDAVLIVKLNDMGHYGCFTDCDEKISRPLYAEATINLIRRKPMGSLAAHSLGRAIVVEFLMVFSLGVVLLFFTCKCAVLLVSERRSRRVKNSTSSSMQDVQEDAVSANGNLSDENATYFTGFCSSPFSFGSQQSNYRQQQ